MSNRAVVVADTGNPAGGFTMAEYESVAAAFDTLVYPVDVRNFGEPTDLDGNGRSIIFYTRAVNELTPPSSGLRHRRVLLEPRPVPAQRRQNALRREQRRRAVLHARPRPERHHQRQPAARASRCSRGTVSVIAHEFQHLINASRRLYVLRTNNYDEVTWLNEGLSHVAEELSFYQAARLSPAGQAGQSAARGPDDRRAARAAGGGGGAQRVQRPEPVALQPLPAGDGRLVALTPTTTGWRRAARRGRSCATPPTASAARQRVPAPPRQQHAHRLRERGRGHRRRLGAARLVPRLGGGQLRRRPRRGPAALRLRELELPAVLPSVATNNNAYPLATRPLADGQAATTSLGGGTAAYFTFTVPAGGTATVRTRAGTAAPSNSIRLTLVRVTDQSGAAVTPYEPGQGADLTVANSGGASAQYALVVFNGSSNVTTREAITVTGTGLGGAPLASSAAAVEAAAAAAQAGPTRARLDASAESLPVTDAPLHRQLRAIGERELAPRVAAARAVYDARRSAGAERQ
jgi:hypothetical protein